MNDVQGQNHSGVRENVILASKRSPVCAVRRGGKMRWIKSPGGLVQVVEPALESGDRWVSLAVDGAVPDPRSEPGVAGVGMRYAEIDRRTSKLFEVACNRVLWFALCGLPIPSRISSDTLITAWVDGYRPANERMAEVIAQEWERRPSLISIQDYQLFLTPAKLRELIPGAQIAFFCHANFPTAGQIHSLPFIYAVDILRGMLACDLLGFQSNRDVAAFRSVCSSLLGVTIRGPDLVWNGRRTLVGVFPVSVDPERLRAVETIETPLRNDSRTVITWVGRSDPAKNPIGAVDAFRQLLREQPGLAGNVVLWLKMYPSRQNLPEFRQCLLDTQDAAIRLNAEMANDSWTPIFLDLSTERSRAKAALKRADVLFVNSFADGMNLVVQEGLLLSERSPALVLSRATGAWERLSDGAIPVDPRNLQDVVSGLRQAISLTPGDRKRRYESLVSVVRSAGNPRDWLEAQVRRLRAPRSGQESRMLELSNR